MPPTSSARTEELNSAIESFGLQQYAASRIRKVATESILRAKDDAEFLNWAIDVLMTDEDMAWEREAAVLKKEDAQATKQKLRGGEKRDDGTVKPGHVDVPVGVQHASPLRDEPEPKRAREVAPESSRWSFTRTSRPPM